MYVCVWKRFSILPVLLSQVNRARVSEPTQYARVCGENAKTLFKISLFIPYMGDLLLATATVYCIRLGWVSAL